MKSCVVILSALQVLLFQLSTSCFIFFKSRTCEDWVPKRVPSVEENYRQA